MVVAVDKAEQPVLLPVVVEAEANMVQAHLAHRQLVEPVERRVAQQLLPQWVDRVPKVEALAQVVETQSTAEVAVEAALLVVQ